MTKTPSSEKTLTSLKLEPEDFDTFKVLCVRTKFSLSKLVDRAMHYYNNDENFRKTMHNYKHEVTGSAN
jgi:predicted DNA-binding ribbon-helix-helix protein